MRHWDASDHVRPKGDWRRGNQLLREGDDLKIVVEVLATTTILRETCHAWKALAIMADTTDVAPVFIGKKNVGTKVDCLSNPLQSLPDPRQFK